MKHRMKEVTNVEILRLLNGDDNDLPPAITDEELLAKLNKEPESIPLDYGKALRNAPQGALDIAGNVVNLAAKPDETVKSLKNLFLGVTDKAGKAIYDSLPDSFYQSDFYKNIKGNSAKLASYGLPYNPDMPGSAEEAEYPNIGTADQIIDYFTGYGDWETTKRRIEDNPFAPVADAAAVGTGALGLTKMAGRAGKAALKDPKQMVRDVGKFTTSKKLNEAQIDEIAGTVLEKNLRFTQEGLQKRKRIADEITADIDGLIADGPQGPIIAKESLVQSLEQLKQSMSDKIRSTKNRDIIDKIIDDFIVEIERVKGETGATNYTLAELHEFKKDAYRQVTSWVDGKANKVKTQDSAYIAVSLAAKEILEANLPGIKGKNAELGRMIAAREPMERATKRLSNNTGIMSDGLNIVGGTSVGLAAQSLFPDIPGLQAMGTIGGMARGRMQRPITRQNLAQKIYKAKNAKGPISDAALAKAMALAIPYLSQQGQ